MDTIEWQKKKTDWYRVTGLNQAFFGRCGPMDLRGLYFTFFGKRSATGSGTDAGHQIVVDMVVAGVGYFADSEMHVGTHERFYLLATVAGFGAESAKFLYDEYNHRWRMEADEKLYVGSIEFSRE